MKRMTLMLGAVLLPVMLGAVSARADEIIDVSVNTAALESYQGGAEVQFALTDGSGPGDGNNTVLLSHFALGGGTAGAVDLWNTTFNTIGDLGSGVSIVDNLSYSEFAQGFNPGASLSFTLDATTNVDSPIPDGFFMYITDPTTGSSLFTTQDYLGNSLFSIAFPTSNGAAPTVTNYDSALVTLTSPAGVSAPEPDSASTMAAGIALLGGWIALRRVRERARRQRPI